MNPSNLSKSTAKPGDAATFVAKRMMVGFLGFFGALHAYASPPLSILVNGASETVVLDQANHNMWFWDLSAFAGQTYSQQLAGIQQLNATTYFDSANWHLATPEEMQQLWAFDSETIRQYFRPSQERYEGGYQWHYWSGRYEEGNGGIHAESETAWGNFFFGPFDYAWPSVGYLSDVGGYQEHGAFIVSSVPEPGLVTFYCLGGLLLLGSRAKKYL